MENNLNNGPQVVIARSPKSVGLSLILTILFGPPWYAVRKYCARYHHDCPRFHHWCHYPWLWSGNYLAHFDYLGISGCEKL